MFHTNNTNTIMPQYLQYNDINTHAE